MQCSLDSLVKNLKPEQLENLNTFEDTHSAKLLQKKGVYPYDYMNSFSKFKETKLPSKENFYSFLNETNISDKDYQHAQNVFKTFNCKNMKDYHNIYLKTDVLLLADVFKNLEKHV